MRFTRIITFSIISALSIGALVGVAEGKKAPVDKTFTIKDIKGERQALQSISFESILKVDTNKFETVTLTKDSVKFKETKFDTMYGVGEKVLNNKDVYRGMDYAEGYENDKMLILAEFNPAFPYGSDDPYVNIVKQNKETKKITKEKIQVPSVKTNQQRNHELLFERNNKLYYAMVLQSIGNQPKTTLKVFEINDAINQIKEVNSSDLTLSGDYTDTSELVADNGTLYLILSSQEEMELVQLNMDQNQIQKHLLPFHSKNNTYINTFKTDQNYFYITSDVSSFVVNKKTLKIENKKEMKPSFVDEYEYISAMNTMSNENTLYVIYDVYKNNKNDRLLVAYDIQTGSTLYEGKLPNMNERGVGRDFDFTNSK